MSFFSKIQKVEKLSRSLRRLYWHRVIRYIGLGLVSLFSPIFLYIITGRMEAVLIFYGLISLCYVLLLPVWAKLLKLLSMHIWMVVGSCFLVFELVVFSWLAVRSEVVWLAVCLLIGLGVMYRLFYWTPYHIDFARFVNKHHRGRQFSFLGIILALIGVILPAVSGLVVAKLGFSILFILATFFIFLSAVPLFFVPRTKEIYTFKYGESFKKLFAKRHLRTNLAYFADGFQSNISYYVWPVFIFLLLKGEYLSVGLVSAAIVLVACVVRFMTGEAVDRFDKKKMMRIGSSLYAVGWVLKAIVANALHIFVVGVFHDFSYILYRTPLAVLTYEIAADEEHYIDEFSVLKEMALHLGKFSLTLLALTLLLFLPLMWVFILGAGMSLLVNLISKEEFRLANHKSTKALKH